LAALRRASARVALEGTETATGLDKVAAAVACVLALVDIVDVVEAGAVEVAVAVTMLVVLEVVVESIVVGGMNRTASKLMTTSLFLSPSPVQSSSLASSSSSMSNKGFLRIASGRELRIIVPTEEQKRKGIGC
jgi:hypothetical protein